MSNKLIDVGDLVSIKGIATTQPIFVWDRLNILEEEFLIVNVPIDTIGITRFKPVEDREANSLYTSFHYILLKEYELLKQDPAKVYEDDTGLIRELIINRNKGNLLSEFLFKYYLRNGMDRVELLNLFRYQFIPVILEDVKCTVPKEDIAIYLNQEIVTHSMEGILHKILIHYQAFLIAKQAINFATCASQIVVEDVPLLEKLKNDKGFLESLLTVFNKKNDYGKVQYSPKNTSKDKPIIQVLTSSFFEPAKPELRAYADLKKNSEQWLINNSSEIINRDAVNTDWLLSGKLYEHLYPLLFGDLAESLPLGNCRDNYKLQFYIPIFKWMLPDVFCDNPKLTASELKKQRIRNIQKFITGNL
ncbi:MAG: hypothetical protein JST49_11750 [Bacteroidetes bacterium]|nr:hypothetical protein [Bacteroidota bacterium]